MCEGECMMFCLVFEQVFGLCNLELLQCVLLVMLCENFLFEEDYQLGDLVEFNVLSGGKYVGVFKEVGEIFVLFDFNYLFVGQMIVFEVQLIGIF